MRVVFLLAMIGLLLGCSNRSTFPVAMGGEHRLPAWNGSCDGGVVHPDGVVRFGKADTSAFTAVAEGDATIRCERGEIVLQVRRIARLEIEGPDTAARGAKTFYQVIAFSAGGVRLAVGDAVEWKLAGPAHPADRCDHMLGSCAEAWQQPLIGDAAGSVTLSATVAGVAATRVITIGP